MRAAASCLLGFALPLLIALPVHAGVFAPVVPAPGGQCGALGSPRAVATSPDGSYWFIDRSNATLVHRTPGLAQSTTVGGSGSAPGQYLTPSGLAVANAGDVYVVDQANSRITRLSPSGAFVSSFGTPGLGVGELYGPSALAIGHDGDLYVVDQFGHRIVRLRADGSFVQQWGSHGSAPGQFDLPSGIAIDRRGDVYITDLLNHRIQKFTSDGRFLRAWGGQGNAPGQLNLPAGIAIDLSGRIHVTEVGNHRVQLFESDGTVLGSWGSFGAAAGQLREPVSIAIGADDRVYVAEQSGGRIQILHRSGAFEGGGATYFAGPVESLPISIPLDGGFVEAPNGDLFAVNFYGNQIAHTDRHGVLLNMIPSVAPMLTNPTSLCIGPEGNVYTVEYGSRLVKGFTPEGTPVATFGGAGFTDTRGIAADIDGSLLISDWSSPASIRRTSLTGTPLGSIQTSGNIFSHTTSDGAGGVYTFDERNVFSRSRSGLIRWSFSLGINSGSFLGPGAICRDLEGGVYVADGDLGRLLHFDADGQLLESRPGGLNVLGIGTYSRFQIDRDGQFLQNEQGAFTRGMIAARLQPPVDVRGDAGGRVHIRFYASTGESGASAVHALRYEVLGRFDGPVPPGAVPDPQAPAWEKLATLLPSGAPEYSVDVVSHQDADPAHRVFTAFMVRTVTTNNVLLNSNVEFGESHDDVPPSPASEFHAVYGAESVALHWTPPVSDAPTLWELHRVADPAQSIAEDTRLSLSADTSYVDPGPHSEYYRLVGRDAAGNLSAVLTLGPLGLLDAPLAGGGGAFALAGARPNPAPGSGFFVQFSLGEPSAAATLDLFDAAGRHWAQRSLRGRAAGPQEIRLVPERQLPPGLYLLRLQDGRGNAHTRRVVIAR